MTVGISIVCGSLHPTTRSRPWIMETMSAIQLDFDEDDDAAILDRFYGPEPLIDSSSVNGSPNKYWSLSLPVVATLYRLGRTLLSDQPDNRNNANYLFDRESAEYGHLWWSKNRASVSRYGRIRRRLERI